MKKIYLILTFAILIIPRVVLANVINNIDIVVYVDNDGNAHVKEKWDTYTSENTEFYKAYYNLGNSNISNFNVSMNGINFEVVDWDISKGFDEKKYKYGYYYTDDGVELCFGISRYGNNTYYLNYDISNFIVNTSDNYQMLYWNLLQPSSDTIENANIKIYSDFDYDSDLFIRSYGKSDSSINSNGNIIISSDGELDSSEYLTILVKFSSGTFNTKATLDKTFDEYLEMANDGATSDDTSIFVIVLFILFGLLMFFIAVVILANSVKYGTYKLDFGKMTNKVKEKGYYRYLPYKKEELSRAYWIACQYNLIRNQTDFLGAILLKWLKLGNICIEKDKKDKSIIIFNSCNDLNKDEILLYQMMYEASKDGKLEKKEFEKWCSSNYSKMIKWFNDVIDGETEKLISEGKLIRDGKKKKCIVNSSMITEANKLKGLKNFLNDFSKIEDREANLVVIWEEYLMYAMMFGIAKKVMKEFKDLYPDIISEEVYNNFYYIYLISYNSVNNASSNYSFGAGGGGSFGSGGSMGSR